MNRLINKDRLYINSVVFRMTVIVYLILSINYYINKDITTYFTFINYFVVIVGLSLIFINNIVDIKREERFIDYLVWGYLCNNILLLISNQLILDISWSAIILQSLGISKYLILHIGFSYETLLIAIAIICYKKRIGNIKTNIICFISMLYIAIIYYFFFKYGNGAEGLALITIKILILGPFFIAIFASKKSKKILNDNKYLKSYLMLVLLIPFIFIIVRYFEEIKAVYIIYTLKLLAYTIIFVNIENELIIVCRKNEIKEINEAKANRSNLNIYLNKKEKLLKELQEKSKCSLSRTLDIMDNIIIGILIFEDDELTYINDEGKRYIKYFYVEGSKLSFESCIQNLTGIITNEEVKVGFTKKIVYIDEKYKINEIEVSTKVIERKSYVVLIRNNTDSRENLKMKEVYDNYMMEEEMREEFYSNVSHELRTPINVISTAIQFNEKIIDDEDKDAIIYRNNKVIKQNCNRLIRTINNFIDANKITEGYFQGNKETINLVYLIDDIVQASSGYVQLKSSNLIYDPQEEEIYITCNIDSIKRILFNLISNSLKYGEENGNILITTKEINRKVELEVKYKGKKIPEDKIMYIFEKFTKLDKYLTRGAEGSGLGLYITKKFVEQHGGKIEIFSDDNGNVFKITLPVSSENITVNNSSKLSFNNLKEQVDIEFSDIYF